MNQDWIDENTLELARSSDPAFDGVRVTWTGEEFPGIDFSFVGYNIGENISISNLILRGFDDRRSSGGSLAVNSIDWCSLFNNVSRSQTIKSMVFEKCYLGGHILNLFNACNLEKIKFKGCIVTHETERAIKSVIGLRHVEIWNDCKFIWAQGFFLSLNHSYKLEHLELKWSGAGKNAYSDIGVILSDPKSVVKTLRIISEGEDEHLLLLKNGLANSSSLREFRLRTDDCVTEEGWQAVSQVLSSSILSLRCLDLNGSVIYPQNANILAAGIACNTTLAELRLSGLGFLTPNGWLALIAAMQNPNLQLRKIDLSMNDAIDDEVISSLAGVVAEKDAIEDLSLRDCWSITSAGWITLSKIFQCHLPHLKKLFIGNENFTDDTTLVYVDCLRKFSLLENLGIACPSITNIGWKSISKLLQNNGTHIRRLRIGMSYCDNFGDYIDDNVAEILAGGLAGNTKLNYLDFGFGHRIIDTGWEAFSRALCNTSSLDAICKSNHSLCQIDALKSIEDQDGNSTWVNPLPAKIQGLLELNGGGKTIRVARQKMLSNYQISAEEGLPIEIIPSVVSWLGKDHHGFDALYSFIKGNPNYFQIRRGT